MKMFTYKLTHDTGFAPNPFGKALTLATCKPGMRKKRKVGEWVAGFSSVELSTIAKKTGVHISPDAIIYIGQISKVLSLGEYFDDPQFADKKPPENSNEDLIACCGDNMYRELPKGAGEGPQYEKITNIYHCDRSQIERDIAGKNVLIFDRFTYLGRKAQPLPSHIVLNRPNGPTTYGYGNDDQEQIKAAIDWMESEFGTGRIDYPCLWDLDATTSGTCS